MNKNIDSVKIGIIGLGKMGQNHLRIFSLLKSVEIQFGYDSDIKAGKEVCDRIGITFSENLENDLKSVEAVVIVTPTSTHYDYYWKVIPYVKNVFIEKPLTDSTESTKEIVAHADKNGINLIVGFIERFNSTIVDLKKLTMEKHHIFNIEFVRTNKLSARILDVDVIIDLMIHDIDLALYLVGPVRDLYAYGITDGRQIIYASVVITHENGIYSTLTASRVTEKRIRQINVTCDNMYIDCNLLSKELLIHKQTVNQMYRGVYLSSTKEVIEVSNQEALLSEDAAFVEAVRKRGRQSEQLAGGYDALKAITIASDIQKQIWSKNAAKN